MHEYTVECGAETTFDDVIMTIARLERIDVKRVKMMINFDEVSRSAISGRSTKGIGHSPISPMSAVGNDTLKRHRSSLDCRNHLFLSQHKV